MVWLSYFDKPDGEDCFQKLWYATTRSIEGGVVYTLTDLVLISKPQTFYGGLARAVHFLGPCAMMGATAATVACSTATIRKKDDVINYIIGGFAGGSIWGAKFKSLPIGVGIGALGAAAAVLLKISHRDNWDMFKLTYPTKSFGLANHYKYDMSIRKDPKDL